MKNLVVPLFFTFTFCISNAYAQSEETPEENTVQTNEVSQLTPEELRTIVSEEVRKALNEENQKRRKDLHEMALRIARESLKLKDHRPQEFALKVVMNRGHLNAKALNSLYKEIKKVAKDKYKEEKQRRRFVINFLMGVGDY